MSELITINNVRGYLDENGTAQLNLEDVSRGLGFARIAPSGNEVVRWETVRRYLEEMGVPTSWHENSQPVGKDGLPEYIPENIFYKLCFKASNETARKFQDSVTDEVLPSIRKHGAYLTPAKIEEVLLNPDTIIQLATALKEEQTKNAQLSKTVAEQEPAVAFAKAVSASSNSILVGDMAKILNQNGVDTGEKRFFKDLREQGYLCKERSYYNKPTQYSMDLKIMEYSENVIVSSSGQAFTKFTPRVTGKGQIYFTKRYLKKETVTQLSLDEAN